MLGSQEKKKCLKLNQIANGERTLNERYSLPLMTNLEHPGGAVQVIQSYAFRIRRDMFCGMCKIHCLKKMDK